MKAPGKGHRHGRRTGWLADDEYAFTAARRQDEVSAIDLGFPQASIASTRNIFYGAVGERTDRRPLSGR